MPGAVLSYNGDSGALFVNPALQCYSRADAVSMTGTIYQLQSLAVKNGIGSGLDLASVRSSIVPLIAAHNIPLKTKRPVSLVYAIVSRPVINFLANQRKEAQLNALDDSYSPGNESFIGQYSLSKTMGETSGILSAGMALNDKWSVGLSAEASYLFTNYLVDVRARALQNSGDPDELFPPVVSSTEFYQATAHHTGLRLKGGLSYRPSLHHSIGLVLNGPLLKLAGSARLLADISINDMRVAALSPVNLLASTRQSALKATWKDPLQLAAGYTYHHGRYDTYLAAEYFAGVTEYDVVTPRNEAFLRPDTGSRITYSALRLKDARKPILNLAIGSSYRFPGDIIGYVSLRTDFAYTEARRFSDDDGYEISLGNTDIYHAQLGANIKRKRFNLRSGVILSYGKTKDYRQKADFDHPSENNLLMGEPGTTTARSFSAGCIVSYIHNF